MITTVFAFSVLLSVASPQPHSRAFWRAIVENKFEVPAGAAAPALAAELVEALGSPDAEMRDDLAFSILSSWIYTKKLLDPGELRPLTRTLQAQLARGLGGPESDQVLRRSFSALTLSVIAARDNVEPFLSAGEYTALLDSALSYMREETDLRGFHPQNGWIHTTAHTADLLKFLARNPRLSIEGQARVLAALTAKNRGAAVPFAQGEDERMARVVISIARRDDFDRDGFKRWLADVHAAAKFPATPDVTALRAQQNVRHLLSALWTELSVDDRPSDGAEFARTALREGLKTLF
jgi:hypothetical protein